MGLLSHILADLRAKRAASGGVGRPVPRGWMGIRLAKRVLHHRQAMASVEGNAAAPQPPVAPVVPVAPPAPQEAPQAQTAPQAPQVQQAPQTPQDTQAAPAANQTAALIPGSFAYMQQAMKRKNIGANGLAGIASLHPVSLLGSANGKTTLGG
ncbi:TPA: hypothetical protein ACIVLM_000314 [Salmonella enterica subsp. enterica serovar Birkenhead]